MGSEDKIWSEELGKGLLEPEELKKLDRDVGARLEWCERTGSVPTWLVDDLAELRYAYRSLLRHYAYLACYYESDEGES